MVSRARALDRVTSPTLIAWIAAASQVGLLLAVVSEFGSDGVGSVGLAAVAGPLAVLATARIGERIGGPRFGAASAVVLVATPIVATAFFTGGYRHTWLHGIVPALVGARSAGWFGLGASVAIVTAILPRQTLATAGLGAAIVGLVVWGVHPLNDVTNGVHETGWSVAFVEWLPVAGVIGAARRSVLVAMGVGGWLAVVVLHGAHGGYANGAFWRSLSAALPAVALLLSSLGLLAPRLRPLSAKQPRSPSQASH